MFMNYGDLCDCIMRLFLYSDATKFIHYTTDSSHMHELCDETRDCIIAFADSLAEMLFGVVGKPSLSDFADDLMLGKLMTLEEICQHCMDLTDGLKDVIGDNPKLDNVVSLIDDFNGKIAQKKFLATFDNNV